MKEQDLIDLGFERYDVSAEDSGDVPFSTSHIILQMNYV
jgi:hypothetical protein